MQLVVLDSLHFFVKGLATIVLSKEKENIRNYFE
jgi:hypothetical protein